MNCYFLLNFTLHKTEVISVIIHKKKNYVHVFKYNLLKKYAILAIQKKIINI